MDFDKVNINIPDTLGLNSERMVINIDLGEE